MLLMPAHLCPPQSCMSQYPVGAFEICTEINKMRIPHFQINYKFQQMCKEIQRYYNGARYYNPNNRRSNIFDDFDYKIVKETVDATEELLKEYEQIHIKNLEDLTKDL